jgi:hypothetical protein
MEQAMFFKVIETMCAGLFVFGAIGAYAADPPDAGDQAEARFNETKKKLKEEHEANKAACNSRSGADKRACKASAKEKYEQALSAAKAGGDKVSGETKLSAVSTPDRSFLSKSEVEELANGKKWDHVRTADNQKIRWDLRSGGNLFANNYTAGGSDSGTWSVNDQGQLCVKWRGRSQNRCVAVAKEGGKVKLVDSADLSGVYADLSVE